MEEVWKDIPGYDGLYQVSSLGRVKSLDRDVWSGNSFYRKSGQIKSLVINTDGYLKTDLYKNNKRKTGKVHQLVAMAFLDHIPDGYNTVVDHIDNNPLNNKLENLQLISHRDNCSKDKVGYSSKYPGIRLNKGKFEASIQINGIRYYLGRYNTEEDAYKAYLNKLNGQ